ncbi:MAG: TatD family hydrolase [Planctomycetota bacterium]|jgi:TatD DNase family protein
MSTPYFDTHCHLDFPDFEGDLDAVLARAEAAGVCEMLTIGTCLETSQRAVELAHRSPMIYAAVGIHPNHCHEAEEGDLDAIEALAQDERVVAIGETGLDFYRDTCPPETQHVFFQRHLAMASRLGKAIILHSRQSGDALMDRVEAFQAEQSLRGVFHCFTDTKAVLKRALAAGLKIGISGIVTFPKGDNVRDVIPMIPDDQLLLDTDSPFLAPAPHRGKRNEPVYAVEIAAKLAELRGVAPADIGRITTRNARDLFLGQEELGEAEIAYGIRDSLYLALTNDCTNDCGFCARNRAWHVKGHNIRLSKDPSAAEVIEAMGDTTNYREVCFCGFGEPTMRLEVLLAVAEELQRRGQTVRLNTNGQGSLYHGRDIVPDLVGRVDAVSVSLNTVDAEEYEALCRSRFGGEALPGVYEFVRRCVELLPSVTCTVVDMPGVDLDRAREVAERLGASFRVRSFVDVG